MIDFFIYTLNYFHTVLELPHNMGIVHILSHCNLSNDYGIQIISKSNDKDIVKNCIYFICGIITVF